MMAEVFDIVTGKIAFGDAALMSLTGIGLVFLVLAFLAFFIFLLGKIVGAVTKKGKKKDKAPEAPDTPAAPATAKRSPVVLENISEKDAALVMAIVADNSGIPLENLDFKSIKLIEG